MNSKDVSLIRSLVSYIIIANLNCLLIRDMLLTALPESTSESHLQKSDSITKLTTDEETEVPPPPGTEPLLPIPALVSSPERERERSDPSSRDKKERDNEYSGERQSRERQRSFSRDGHRDR